MARRRQRQRFRDGAWVLFAMGLPVCDDPGGPSSDEVQLAQVDAWVRVADAGQDVFGHERPDGLVCDEVLGLAVETFGDGEAFEINTDACNYATVGQPSVAPIAAGDTLTIRVWHYELQAPMPAQGHVALAIDGQIAWETMVPIPSEAGMIEEDFVADRDIPAGAALQFHVHNHGVNTWDLIDITVSPGGDGDR